jgi:hypothetical protein
MKHLLTTLERFTDWNKVETAFIVRNKARGMVNELASILSRVKDNTTAVDLCQSEYKQVITLPNHFVGSFYIDVCELLSTEIKDAELRYMFPATHAKNIEWSCTLGSGDEFQPKIDELMRVIQHDINSPPSNSYNATLRTKIGFIGYISVGKTTLMCRLLRKDGSNSSEFLPVHTTKSTYYPLQHDFDIVLVSPDDHLTATAVTFVDIQGCDKGSNMSGGVIEAGNYLDEIRKADCDIYVIVFNEDLDDDQYKWITFIKQIMKRQCILARSKVDDSFLAKFREKWDVCYAMSSQEERTRWSKDTIDDLRCDFEVEGHSVYLTAANYRPTTSDAALLLQDQSFDLQLLHDELGRLASSTHTIRVYNLAARAVERVINSCFRRGYVINTMKYKIGAGIAVLIPFVDLVPKYLARESIQEAFGITEDFLRGLDCHELQIIDEQLQTSVFKGHVTILKDPPQPTRIVSIVPRGLYLGIATVGGTFFDDIIRAVAPALSTLSLGARVALSTATIGAGVALSVGVGAWSFHNTGKHIFRHVNQLCDDIIVVSIPLTKSMIEQRPAAPMI